jgi:hypothetical protein
MRTKLITKKDCINNAMAYNKYLSVEYLSNLPFKWLLRFCHPDLRQEVKELGIIIN